MDAGAGAGAGAGAEAGAGPSLDIFCPEKPSALGLVVGGDAWWLGQRETIDLIVKSFVAGKKFVMAGIPTGGGKCVAPQTKILTDDLRWVTAESLSVGDQVASIEEYSSVNRRRRLLPATVLDTGHDTLPCYRLTLETGETLVCTDDHKWLCVFGKGRKVQWKTAQEIAKSLNEPQRKQAITLYRFFPVWEQDGMLEYDRGYLAGVFDGEGSINASRAVNRFNGVEFTQRDNCILRHVRLLLTKYNYAYTERDGSKGTRHISLDTTNGMRLLGQVRPLRLLDKWMRLLDWPTSKTNRKVQITRAEYIGMQEVVTLTTSTQTFIAEGFGSHNTLIASAVQTLLARQQLGSNSLVLTHTIQLQDQYQKTLTGAALITGRGNWLCDLPADAEARIGEDSAKPLTAETAPCTEGACPEDLKHKDGCGYYRQWWQAADAPMVIANYAYASRILQIPKFSAGEGQEPINNPFRRSLLVADECHLAHDAIVEASGIKLWTGSFDRLGIQLPSLATRVEVLEGGPRSQKRKLYENNVVWIAWAAKQLEAVKKRAVEAQDTFTSMKLGGNKAGQREALSRLRSVRAVHESLKQVAAIKEPDEWIVRRDSNYGGKTTSVTIQPLWGWTVSHARVFNYFRRILLMSATPGNPEVARVKLGIKENEFEYIERPSTFKPESRPVYFWPVANMGYSSDDADWDRMAKAIGWVATRPDHSGRKGIVHSGSHANAKRLVQLLAHYLPGREVFTHDSGSSRAAALTRFKSSSSGACILVTASFTTGIDLPYLIGWQVIAKVPFGSLADDITARRKAYKLANGFAFGQSCYTDECANTVVQAAGRIVRAPDDSGPTYILDGNWKIVSTQAYLPKFFLDSYSKVVFQ